MTDVNEIYSDMLRFIEANYHLPITLVDFCTARMIPQSDAQGALSYRARSWAGMVLDERMKHAKELLAYSSESVEVIGSCVGYDDTSQFVRTFKAEEGKEPEEYRQWIQNQTQPQAASRRNESPSS